MTDMQLIIPPVEDNENHGDTSHDGVASRRNGVLPDYLRDSFENMQAAWRQARRTDLSEEDVEELKRKEREVAVETAVAVDVEVSRWQTRIAELEALLAAEEEEHEEDEESDDEPVVVARERQRHVIRFPSLPPVIPPEDDDSSSDGRCSDSKSAASTSS